MKFFVLATVFAFAAAGPLPQISHDAAVALLKQTQYDLSQPIVAQVPGLGAHQAAEAQVLAAQGRVPGSPVHAANEARVAQAEAQLLAIQEQQAKGILPSAPAAPRSYTAAEAQLIALQQQQALANSAGPVGLVGPSGSIGPSGLVGPSGNIQF